MKTEPDIVCPRPLHPETVQLAHGGGGRMQQELLRKLVLPALGAPGGHDSAVLAVAGVRLAFTTDTFVVHPRVFPGGDIGKLAVCGTVNDLAVAGARPLWLSVALVIEEGLSWDELGHTLASLRETAQACGVAIVTGDTKVVDRGKGDGLFINTAGIGLLPDAVDLHPARVVPGDLVLLSGDVGRHGVAVLTSREGIAFETSVESDCAPVTSLVAALLASGADVHCLRDPTRGGVAAVLHEIASAAGCSVAIEEAAIPVDDGVAGACEVLGLDPLYVACEGRFLAFIAERDGARALEALRGHPAGGSAALVGRVTAGPRREVVLRTRFGADRLLDLPASEPLPRIC